MPLAPKAVFLDLAAAGDRVVAVGERGIVVWSDDAGSTWTQASVPVRSTLAAVTFVDDKVGYAVGHDATVIRTSDGGQTWEILQYDPAAENVFLNVRFRDSAHGYVVGTNGQLLVTNDGAATWQAQTLAVEDWYQNHLFDVNWTPAGTLVVAEKGVLYRSADGVSDWASVPSPYEGSYFGARVQPDASLLIFGMSGRMFRSPDGGNSWEPVQADTRQFLYDADVLSDGSALVVGAGGTYCVVPPMAQRVHCKQIPGRVGLTAVLVRDDRVFLAMAGGGVRITSLNELSSQP